MVRYFTWKTGFSYLYIQSSLNNTNLKGNKNKFYLYIFQFIYLHKLFQTQLNKLLIIILQGAGKKLFE